MREKSNVEASEKQRRKKEMVTGNGPKRQRIGVLLIAAGILAVGGGFVAVEALRTKGVENNEVIAAGSVKAEAVTHPVALFDDGKARHFQYEHDGITVRYFVLKSSDGVIRAAFDACDVCWSAGRGYVQDGDTMICRNCGRRFASVRVNEVKGGCNPAPLSRSVQGDQLVILVSDILEGKSYFDFSKKG